MSLYSNLLEVPNSRVIVSSDDDVIISVAKKYGAETPFKRPNKLSKYDSPSIDVIMHTLKWLKENEKYEHKLVIFKPQTNPFISSDSINKMKEIIKNDNLLVNSIDN